MKSRNPPPEESAETFEVTVETVAWISTFLGKEASGSHRFSETAHAGDKVRDVLSRFSCRFPKLDEALWEGDLIGPHIEIIVNGTILGTDYQLDSSVKPGDEIVLAGQFVGG